MPRHLLISLLFITASALAKEATVSRSLTPTETEDEGGDVNFKINPAPGKAHFAASVEFQLAPKWTFAAEYGHGFFSGSQRASISTNFGYSSGLERTYSLDHLGLKVAHYFTTFTAHSWFTSAEFFAFRGGLNVRGTVNGNETEYTSPWQGTGLLVSGGYRWRWPSGFNLSTGMGFHYSPSMDSYPDATSNSGERIEGGPLSAIHAIHLDLGLGYAF